MCELRSDRNRSTITRCLRDSPNYIWLLAALAGCTTAPAQPPADLLVTNARIYAADGTAALHEAIAACTPADCDADDRFRAGTGPENPKAAAVKRAMSALDALDRATIKTNTDLNASAASNLSGALRTEYTAL